MFSRENSLLTISWIREVFHPSDELPIKTSIYYSLYKMCQHACIISVRSKDIMQKNTSEWDGGFLNPEVWWNLLSPSQGLSDAQRFQWRLTLSGAASAPGSSDSAFSFASWNSNSPQLFLFNVLNSFSIPTHVKMETKGTLAGLVVPKRERSWEDSGRVVWVTYGLSCNLWLPQGHSGTMTAWPGFSRWDISLF